jgi:hypothetical protein
LAVENDTPAKLLEDKSSMFSGQAAGGQIVHVLAARIRIHNEIDEHLTTNVNTDFVMKDISYILYKCQEMT